MADDSKKGGESKRRMSTGKMQRSESSASISQLLLHPFGGRRASQSTDRRVSQTRYSVSSYQHRSENMDARTIPTVENDDGSSSVNDSEPDGADPDASDLTLEEYRATIRGEDTPPEGDQKVSERTAEEGNADEGRVQLETATQSDEVVTTAETADDGMPTGPTGWWRRPSVWFRGQKVEPESVDSGVPDEDQLEPNKVSEVETTERSGVAMATETAAAAAAGADDDTTAAASAVPDTEAPVQGREDGREGGRWWWWGSKSNGEPDTVHEASVDELQMRTADAQKAMKAMTSNSGISTSWMFNRKVGEPLGQLSIVGTRSFKEPFEIRKPIPSQYEVKEATLLPQDLDESDITDDVSVVVPKMDWNYRNLTLRTKARIELNQMGGLLEKWTHREEHLYHDPASEKPSKSAPEPKRVLVVGIHSFLPWKLVNGFVGEPTGSAETLVEQGVSALENWTDKHKVDLDVETVALDGYGKVFERVSHCITLLEGFDLGGFDWILVSANYQGVPVAIHVLSRLITAGYLSDAEKVGLVGMQAPCLGPAAGLDSKLTVKPNSGLENELLLELFDFQDPETLQSKELVRHLQILINEDVKMCLFASLSDRLTPLYSALCAHVTHPNLYRAVYVDGSYEQPDFVVTLLNLLLGLKNLGLDDHMLLVELSEFFQDYARVKQSGGDGSGSGSQSKKGRPPQRRPAYSSRHVYKLGLQDILETTSLFKAQEAVETQCDVRQLNANEYHLPWCMRGFLHELGELNKKTDTKELVLQLLSEFRSWSPSTKPYQSLRYCIEPLERMRPEDVQ